MPLLCSEGHLSVGTNTLYNGTIRIVASEHAPVHIGSYCAIGENLKIIPLNHDYNFPAVQGTFYRSFFGVAHPGSTGTPTRERTKGAVTNGSDVWIGDDVQIMSGVTIGDGAVIGAKSVVTSDIPPFSVAAGIPCRLIKPRFQPNMAAFLAELRWWEWDDERIIRNQKFFCLNLNAVTVEEARATLCD